MVPAVMTRARPARPRIVHVLQNLNYGGMERIVGELIKRTDHEKYELHLLALQYLGRFAEGLDAWAELHVSDPLPRWTMLYPAPLAAQLRRIGPDIVHTHSGVWYKASLAARWAGVRHIVHTEHGRRHPDPWIDRLVDSRAARRTSLVVAVSDELADQLGRMIRSGPRIEVIRNGVDVASFASAPAGDPLRETLGIAADAPVLGSVGRLEPIKGYDVMLAAYEAYLSRRGEERAAHLVMIGDGSQRGELEARAARRGLEGKAHFLGWRDDIPTLLPCFTLFTMSSRSEGTSVSLLEAMSAGLCPVVTDVGGNGKVLGPTLRHRLVPPEDPAALAEAWRAALQDAGARQADARRAREQVEARFSVDAMAQAYQAAYATLLRDDRVPSG